MTYTATDNSQDRRRDTDTVQIRCDGAERLSMSIVRTIADKLGLDPTEMEPLFYTIDPELIDRMGRGGYEISGDIMFDYQGFRVTVTSDRQISMYPLSESEGETDSPRSDVED